MRDQIGRSVLRKVCSAQAATDVCSFDRYWVQSGHRFGIATMSANDPIRTLARLGIGYRREIVGQ